MTTETSKALGGLDLSGVTGNAPYDYYFAVGTRQGNRDVYTIHAPVEEAVRTLPIPNPVVPTPGNRRVNAEHAKKFGLYVRHHEDWVAPALIVRATHTDVSFEEQNELPGGIKLGLLGVPRSSKTAIRILDGQHRILGAFEGWNDLTAAIARSEDAIARDKNGGKPEDLKALQELKSERNRFLSEHFTIQVYIETQPDKYEQMFYDIADNALGINQAVKVRFDSRKVVNRTLMEVTKHALLVDRVDEEQDRIKGPNPNLLGAKHVADLVRAVTVGVAGRISKTREEKLDDAELVEDMNDFLDALAGGFADPFEKLIEKAISAQELRETSLLGSVTMLRVLAGVYHVLVQDGDESSWTKDEVQDFFEDLAPHMKAPVAAGSVWLTTGDFDEGAYGPRARSQNLKHLTTTIVGWALVGKIG